MQTRVGILGDEGVDLVLGPLAAEDRDDGGLATEEGGGVVWFLVGLEECAAEEVGEEEGHVGFEEAWRREEGFALVVFEVAPVAEVRPRKTCSPVTAG